MPNDWQAVGSTDHALAGAQSLLAVGRFDEAAAMLRSAMASEPDDPRPRALLAAALIDHRRFRDGLREADRALGVAPDNATCHRVRAYALLELKRQRPALEAVTESLRLDPQASESFVVLAEIQLAMRNVDDAERSAQEAARLEPNGVQARDLLGRAALIKKNLPAAENYFRSALALEPTRWQTLYNLSAVLLHQGRAEEAAEVFQAAVRLQPQDPFLLRALANVTSREAIIGALVFSWMTLSVLSRFSFGLPASARAVISVVLIAACAAFVFKVWSRRNKFVGRLSAPTMVVAKLERKAQRRRNDQRAAFTIGVAVAIWILGAVVSFVIGLGLPLLLAFPVGVVWLFVAPLIWDRRILARLEAADQSKE